MFLCCNYFKNLTNAITSRLKNHKENLDMTDISHYFRFLADSQQLLEKDIADLKIPPFLEKEPVDVEVQVKEPVEISGIYRVCFN
jgi:hypothetical protein